MYVGFTTMTLSKRLTMYFNDFCPIALHFNSLSIPKSKFLKNLS